MKITSKMRSSIQVQCDIRVGLRCLCFTSSFAPPMPPLPLCLPIASISSMKTMQGAFALASLNRSRTLDEPTPEDK